MPRKVRDLLCNACIVAAEAVIGKQNIYINNIFFFTNVKKYLVTTIF